MTNPKSSIPWRGIIAGLGAAVFYTLASAFLRKLATETDFVTVVFMKAATTALIFTPWLFIIASRHDKVLPSGRYLWVMIFGAIQAQIFGNQGQQIALGIIGIAITVPIYIGSLVASSALLGFLFLKERISPAVIMSLRILVTSVALLSCGGEQARDSIQEEQAFSMLANAPMILGVAAAVACGIAFAVLAVCIRYVLSSGVPTQTPLVFVSVTGVVGFGITMLIRDGGATLMGCSANVMTTMVAAGLCNAIAFLCFSTALRELPVVYVNAINVSQVALAAFFGVTLFCEPLSIWLAIGLVLMVAGFFLLANFTAQENSEAPKLDEEL